MNSGIDWVAVRSAWPEHHGLLHRLRPGRDSAKRIPEVLRGDIYRFMGKCDTIGSVDHNAAKVALHSFEGIFRVLTICPLLGHCPGMNIGRAIRWIDASRIRSISENHNDDISFSALWSHLNYNHGQRNKKNQSRDICSVMDFGKWAEEIYWWNDLARKRITENYYLEANGFGSFDIKKKKENTDVSDTGKGSGDGGEEGQEGQGQKQGQAGAETAPAA